ncbi:serotriflin-like isoform X2 [Hemicordylus capensis]|nr:serotriflin-like isoform X2 [Hemicordylus capensis]
MVNPPAANMLKMLWNDVMAKNAQRWADKCVLDHSPQADRKGEVNWGENLYMSSAPNSWSTAIQAWYDEATNFVYGHGANSANAVIGHYTQVVWYRSNELGCGCAYCPNAKYKYYYVCQYSPAGNIQSKIHTPYKKGKPCEDCPNACDEGLCTNPCRYYDRFSNCPTLAYDWTCTPDVISYCPAACHCVTEIQ